MSYRFFAPIALGLLLASPGPAAAQEDELPYYVVLTGGAVFEAEGQQSGRLREDFAVPLADAVLTDGAAYRFRTDYEIGGFVSLAAGKTTPYGPYRSEFELSYSRSDVDRHRSFRALGQSLDLADSGILTASTSPTETPLGSVLRDAQGSLETYAIMINGYREFAVPREGVLPYLGAGLGAVRAEVDYSPSGEPLIDDGVWIAGYQLMAGIDVETGGGSMLRAGLRYRGGQTIEVDTEAPLTSELEIDYGQTMLEIGWRWAL